MEGLRAPTFAVFVIFKTPSMYIFIDVVLSRTSVMWYQRSTVIAEPSTVVALLPEHSRLKLPLLSMKNSSYEEPPELKVKIAW